MPLPGNEIGESLGRERFFFLNLGAAIGAGYRIIGNDERYYCVSKRIRDKEYRAKVYRTEFTERIG